MRFEKPRRTPPEVPGCPLYRKYDVTNFVLVHFDQSCDRKVLEALLRDGVSVQEGRRRRKYVFLGHSPSQLRNATCVLFNAGKALYSWLGPGSWGRSRTLCGSPTQEYSSSMKGQHRHRQLNERQANLFNVHCPEVILFELKSLTHKMHSCSNKRVECPRW